MAVSLVYKILWGTGLVFVILPHLNLGLLSDYKICGDSECESLMSRVQAIKDHHAKDCRFLSFRRGDTIFVYHKLTGKREDLWAGSIDKQFGYFPKDAVKEEQVHATMEKVVETQKSDFFCMDESGFPTDTSHLDGDDDNGDDIEKIKNQESEITQTTPYDDTYAESPSTPADVSTELPASTQDAAGTSTEEDESNNGGDAAAGTHEEAQEAPNEQGGSASSPWFGSSVTGWLGLDAEEEPGILAEGEKKDETQETQASFASSVTGWLGLGGEGKPVDAVISKEEERETDDSFTSTMTGWLGFGGEEKTHTAEKEQDEERENDKEQEPGETFRSRRMSLDLEGSQLHEEEKEEMGTLDWLGNGLSSTLGFGRTNQESGHEATTEGEVEETTQEEEEQPASSSWFDMGIGDILGFREDKSEVDESTGSGVKETDKDEALEQATGSENVDQSQPALTEEVRTENSNEAKVEETPKDQNTPSETDTMPGTTEPPTADIDNSDLDILDISKDSVLPDDAASEVDKKYISPQAKLGEKSQAAGGMSSSFFQIGSEEEEQDNVLDDNNKETKVLDRETVEEMEGKDHQVLTSIENEGEDNNSDIGEEEMQTASETDQDFLTQSDIHLGSNSSSVDLNSNSTGQSIGEQDKTEDVVEERAESPNQIDTTEESTDPFVKTGAGSDDQEGEGNNAEAQTDDSAEYSHVSGGAQESSGESQPFLSSGSAEEKIEPVSSEDDTLPAHSDVAHSDSLAVVDNYTEADTHQGELEEEGEGHRVGGSSQEFGSSHSTNRSTETMTENAPELDRKMSPTSESTTQMDKADSVSLHTQQRDGDAHVLKEPVNETEKDTETETEEVEESKEEEKQGDIEELNVEEKQDELKEEEKQQEVKDIKEERKQEEVEDLREEKKEEIEELQQEEKQEAVRELKEEEKQGEGEELMEESKQEEVKDLREEEKQEEIEELKKEEKQDAGEQLKVEVKEEENKEEVRELEEEENQGEGEKLKGEEKRKELKEERQDEGEELMEESKQEEVEELKKEEKQEVGEQLKVEVKEEENKEEVRELEEEENQGEGEKLKGEEKRKELKEERQDEGEELMEESKQEEVEELKKEEKQEVGEQLKVEVKEEDNKEEVRELEEEENQGEGEKLKGEEKRKELKEERQDEGEELMEESKQEEVEELKKEEKQEVGEQIKVEVKEEDNNEEVREEEERQGEGEAVKGEEKWEEVKEVKEEEKQQQIEELKEEKREEVEDLKEEGRREELKEIEEVREREKKADEENKIPSSHFEAEVGNIDRPESETSTQAENRQAENPQIEKEKTVEENTQQEEAEENVQGERRDKEGEGSLKCPNELCPQASEDGFVMDRDGNDSANRLNTLETGEQNHMADNDQTLADGRNVDRDQDSKREEEKRNNDAEADEGKNEQGEEKHTQSNLTGNEDIKSNNPNSNLALGVNQSGKYTDNDLLYSGETGQNSLPSHILLAQTTEKKEDDQLTSTRAENTDPSDDQVLHQGAKTKPEVTETSSNGVSAEKKTEQIHSDYSTVEFRAEGGTGISVSSSDPVESQAVISEQAVPHASDDHNKGTAEAESGGAFGLFKNTFSFFSQPTATESTESTPTLDVNTGDTSEAQASLTPEQELDSTTDSSQVHVEELHADSPITLSQQQPSPPPFVQTSSTPSPTQTHSQPSSLSPNTGSPLQTQTLSKHHKNLLAHMSADEMTLLIELFGRHKLQFLDYILGSSETMTDDPDDDESILSDIERLLHYHRETLVAPSMRLVDAPHEDKEKTKTLIALQKLEMLLARVRETFNTGKSDLTNTNHQAEAGCVGESCSAHSGDKEMATEAESSKMEDSSGGLDKNVQMDELKGGQPNSGGTEKERVTEEEKTGEKETRGKERAHVQPGPPQPQEAPGVMKQILDFVHQTAEDSTTHVHATTELLIWLTLQVVSSLPDDIRPGPDLYGVPWEPVLFSSLVGLVTVLLFTCRCYSSVKSRMYRSRERWMAEQVAQLLDEKCKVLETLSKCQQEHDDLESSLRDSGVLAQTQKTEHLESKARQLGQAKRELERDLEQLKDQLEQQREHRIEQERRIAVLEEDTKTFEEESKDLQSQDEQAQTTLKVYSMNSDRLQRNLETAGEENTLLKESNAQLRQQVEGWAERVSELEAEISRCEVAHSEMLQDVANKDERIMSLTDRLLRMKAWDSDLEEEECEGGEKDSSNGTAGRGENGRGDGVQTQQHLQKVQKLIYAAKLNADLKSVDEDKDRAFAKLNDEVKAKEDLHLSIKELEKEKLSLQSDSEHYSDQVQRLQQKLHIMTEMYQENELKLHRLLTVEEKERLQKEEKLNKADKNIALAMEELNNYRQRAGEMEEELDKTKQSYQTQISAHEKKAHNNWLAARAAERELADIRRENALFRQKLTDTQFKLDALDKDPYALDSLARPLPFRAERSPYGPSPLGRPASETRAFLSPPTLMDGPPARLSPRVPRGPMEHPGGQGEMERSGGPHSDSGSISPTWERDRRGPPPGPPGPLGPPGYMFPEPGGPMYRRPPPGPPGPLGLLPPPGSIPPGPLHPRGLPPGPPHPLDMADGTYRENSLGPGEQEHRESGPGDRRTPPEADLRMMGAPPPGPPMGPMDGPFPRRAPYDFYPPRGPGGPPMMPMWAPPPPGMMFPPRFPPGGPPHPHHAPPMRPPLPDGLPPRSMGPLPPQQSLPSPPPSQSPEEHTPSPEDVI